MNRKKILFLIPSLVGGGAEKALVDLMTGLDASKYDLNLALFEKKGVYLSHVPPHVPIYDLRKKSRYSFFSLVLRFGALLEATKPDATVSFLPYAALISVLSKRLRRNHTNLILVVQNDLSSELKHERLSRMKHFLFRSFFTRANWIVCVSRGVRTKLIESLGLDGEKVEVIYNPLDITRIDCLKLQPLGVECAGRYILAAARLTKQKGYPYLLKAYSLIHNQIREKLFILGAGEEEPNLRRMCAELRIDEKVMFLGFNENPYKFMKNASLFVLPSLWEGFGNVIVESMACETPVLSTDCPFGPSELIINGETGILVEPCNEKALAEAILILLNNDTLRRKLSVQGRRRIEEFRKERILTRYEDLFSRPV